MDITEPKRTEEALRESIGHFHHLLELGPHVLWVLNDKGEVIEASSRWEEFTGQPLANAMGHGWLKMLHPDDVAMADESLRICLTAGVPIDVYYRIQKPNGGWRGMRARGSPRLDAAGETDCRRLWRA